MKRMKQPRKDVLREQLALAADEIIRLKTEAAHYRPVSVVGRSQEMQRQANLYWTNLLHNPQRAPRPSWWRRLLAWGR